MIALIIARLHLYYFEIRSRKVKKKGNLPSFLVLLWPFYRLTELLIEAAAPEMISAHVLTQQSG